jgi:transcriptional regulator with XRE-family HTH domain
MKKKISNIELAKESGLTPAYISFILTGKYSPSKKTAIILSEATARLGIKTSSVDWMFNIDKVRKLIRGE